MLLRDEESMSRENCSSTGILHADYKKASLNSET